MFSVACCTGCHDRGRGGGEGGREDTTMKNGPKSKTSLLKRGYINIVKNHQRRQDVAFSGRVVPLSISLTTDVFMVK